MNIHSVFSTDQGLEKAGITIDYGDFQVRIARAGGANKEFSKLLDRLTKPYRRAIDTGTIDLKIAERIEHEVYARSVILGWEGVTDSKDKPIKFTPEACMQLFEDLPDFFIDIRQQAQTVVLFRAEVQEGAAKN